MKENDYQDFFDARAGLSNYSNPLKANYVGGVPDQPYSFILEKGQDYTGPYPPQKASMIDSLRSAYSPAVSPLANLALAGRAQVGSDQVYDDLTQLGVPRQIGLPLNAKYSPMALGLMRGAGVNAGQIDDRRGISTAAEYLLGQLASPESLAKVGAKGIDEAWGATAGKYLENLRIAKEAEKAKPNFVWHPEIGRVMETPINRAQSLAKQAMERSGQADEMISRMRELPSAMSRSETPLPDLYIKGRTNYAEDAQLRDFKTMLEKKLENKGNILPEITGQKTTGSSQELDSLDRYINNIRNIKNKQVEENLKYDRLWNTKNQSGPRYEIEHGAGYDMILDNAREYSKRVIHTNLTKNQAQVWLQKLTGGLPND